LLWRLGATVEHTVEGYNDGTDPVVDMVCTAPSEARASQIADQLRTTIKEGEKTFPALQLPDQEERFHGKIQQEANTLKFTDIPHTSYGLETSNLGFTHASKKLPELVSYLEAQGCRNFEFDISASEIGY
jgi:hypothetical protein